MKTDFEVGADLEPQESVDDRWLQSKYSIQRDEADETVYEHLVWMTWAKLDSIVVEKD